MWMMGCDEGGGGGFNTTTTTTNNCDSFNGRKLRPLIPKSCNNNNTIMNTNGNLPTSLSSNPPCLSRLRGSDIILFNNHLEQSKREMNTTTTVVSSRWNPTPEQLRTLEELYKRGTRTPTADQIQHITSQLRRYGKIEGKNVFYWFQNHKARERQKRRRRSSDEPASGSSTITDDNNNKQQQQQTECLLETNESRMSKTCYEVEQTKNWHRPTNCSTLTQEPVSVQGTALVSSASAVESRIHTNGWIQLEEREFHHQQHRRNSSAELQATWQMLQQQQHFSSTNNPRHLINTTTTTTPSLIRSLTNPKFTNSPNHHQNLSFLFAPNKILMRNQDHQQSCCYSTNEDKSQTLELFPLRKDVNDSGVTDEKEAANQGMSTTTNNMNTTTPYQFFEFL
ncbi:hypothetical protein MKW94_006353 [Papaver nudicaule]|uniref:Homeobox domain-containing protein n=1 Tax=Papaver nudicaule TaxID=74823 RepID=A0AA41V4K7_PAPNU|nr:hypothetical protein [Papaver nudicaule]